MIMTKSQLEKYYFPNLKILNNIKKYLPLLIDLYGEENLFCNEKLNSHERSIHISSILNITMEYLEKNKNLYYSFAFIYSLTDKSTLAEIIIESVIAYSKLYNPKYKYLDIFLDPNSVLYCDNIYPATIQMWENNNDNTILDYVARMKEIIKILDKIDFNKFNN